MSYLKEIMSAKYDNEINISQNLSFEAFCASSNKMQKIAEKSFFDFYTITKSIKRVINKISILH